MNSKGQIKQVFTYIVSLLLIGAIALVGVQSLSGILSQQEDIQFITFTEDLVYDISQHNIYGTVHEQRYALPKDMSALCFVDASILLSEDNGASFSSNTQRDHVDFVIDSSVDDNVRSNLFLVNSDVVVPIGFSRMLRTPTPQHTLCVNASQGYVELTFKGQGRMTEVSPS